MTTGKTIALTRRTFVGKVVSLLLNMLSRLVITSLPRSKHLLISWLQSPSAVNETLSFETTRKDQKAIILGKISHIEKDKCLFFFFLSYDLTNRWNPRNRTNEQRNQTKQAHGHRERIGSYWAREELGGMGMGEIDEGH